jgi:hypothetical protein
VSRHEEATVDGVIDGESIPWEEPGDESQPGYREKKCVRDGQEVWLIEMTEGYNPEDEWCTVRHLFSVVTGEATLRLRDGDRAIRLRAGDSGIVPGGEAHAHKVEPAAGEGVRVLLFEQP